MATNTVAQSKENQPATIFNVPDDYTLDIAQDDIRMPAIILLQKMSDIVEIEGRSWKAGDFYDMGSDEIVTKPFKAVVFDYHVTARLDGPKDPVTGRAEVERFSSNGKEWDDTGLTIMPSEFKWTENGQFAKKSYHYLILRKGKKVPVVVSFKGASAKVAKTLNMHLTQLQPAWRSYFSFQSVKEESSGNKYHILKASPLPREYVEQDTADLCNKFWTYHKTKTIVSPEMSNTPEDDPAY